MAGNLTEAGILREATSITLRLRNGDWSSAAAKFTALASQSDDTAQVAERTSISVRAYCATLHTAALAGDATASLRLSGAIHLLRAIERAERKATRAASRETL